MNHFAIICHSSFRTYKQSRSPSSPYGSAPQGSQLIMLLPWSNTHVMGCILEELNVVMLKTFGFSSCSSWKICKCFVKAFSKLCPSSLSCEHLFSRTPKTHFCHNMLQWRFSGQGRGGHGPWGAGGWPPSWGRSCSPGCCWWPPWPAGPAVASSQSRGWRGSRSACWSLMLNLK